MATAREVSIGLKKALTERTAGTGTMEEMMAGDRAVLAPTPAAIFGYSCAGPRSQSSDCGPGVTTRQMLQAEGLNFKATQTDPVSALQFQMLEAFAIFEHATQKHPP